MMLNVADKIIKSILFSSFLLLMNLGMSQSNDSFYKIEEFDSLRINFFDGVLQVDPNQSLDRARFILSKSKTKLQRMNAQQCLGVAFTINKEPDSARVYFFRAIEQARSIPEKKHFVSTVVNYSNLDLAYKKNEQLISLLYEALEVSERDDQKTLIYQFLGEAYYKSEDLQKAEEYYLKALPLVGENKTNIYRGLEGLYFRKKEYNKALNYILKSIESGKEIEDVNLAFAYVKAARNYLYLNDLGNAEKYFDYSEKIQLSTSSKVVFGEYFYYKALLYRKLGQEDEILYLNKAEKEFISSQDHYLLKDVYLKKSNYYTRNKNLVMEDQYLEKYLNLHDSLFTSEKNNLKADLETKYLVRENQIELKNKELIIKEEQRQNKWYLFFLTLLTLLVIFVIYFYRKQLTLKDILNKEKVLKIQKDKQLAVLQAKTKERNDLSKKLHDEVASDIFAARIKIENIDNPAPLKGEILTTLNSIYKNVREFSYETKSVDLNQKRFTSWVKEICDDLLGNHLSAIVRIYNEEKVNALNQALLYELLLIIKECAINTKKHSNASEFELQMSIYSKRLFLSIHDDGDVSANYKKGNGLKNIENRVFANNGEMSIDIEDGFRVNFEISI